MANLAYKLENSKGFGEKVHHDFRYGLYDGRLVLSTAQWQAAGLTEAQFKQDSAAGLLRIARRGIHGNTLIYAESVVCLYLKKVDSQPGELTMYQLRTEKQRKYFAEVIRLHYEEGYGERRIERVLPIGHTTVSRWIAIFARAEGKTPNRNDMRKPKQKQPSRASIDEVAQLQSRIRELEQRLLRAEIRAEAYDEMINVAEAKFRVPIRKKAGAKH